MTAPPRGPSDFWRLLGATSISQVGAQVSALAVPLAAVLVLGASAAQIGALTACQSGAYLVAGIPAGVAADKLSHRSILLGCDLVRAAAMASVPLAAAFAALTLAQLYVVVGITGIFTVFADVVRQSTVPRLVPSERLQSANARLAATQSVATACGPGAAGLLIQLVGAASAVTTDTVSYLGSAILVSGLRTIREPVDRTGSPRAGPWSGLRYAFSTRPLRDLMLSSAAYNFVTATGGVVLVVRLARDLHLSPGVIGLLYSIGATGGLAGAVVCRRVADRLGLRATLCGSLLVASAGACLVATVGPGARVVLSALGLFVSGVAVTVYNVSQVTLRQRLTPAALLGRTTGSTRLIVTGAVSLGAVAGGTAASLTSPGAVLWLAAAGSVLATLAVAAFARTWPAALVR